MQEFEVGSGSQFLRLIPCGRTLSAIDDGGCLESVRATLHDDSWEREQRRDAVGAIKAFAALLSAPIH
jgi:hypothetical protein